MKTKLFISAALLCCLMLTQSFTTVSATEINMETNKANDRIKLEERAKSLRSATATNINAHTDGNILTVEVENYTGDVYVQVYGSNGAMQTAFSSYDNGYGALDISSLPAGTYTVTIVIDNEYTGAFVK